MLTTPAWMLGDAERDGLWHPNPFEKCPCSCVSSNFFLKKRI
jgi:hypothetical protein